METNRNQSRQWLYLLFAVLGGILPWQANLEFIQANHNVGFNIMTFIHDANINAASRSLSRDLLIAASAFSIWMISEGKRLEIKGWWITLILSISISFACGGPLFLFLRERKLIALSQQQEAEQPLKDQHPLP